MAEKKAKSPYQKYGKTEYRYSELYRRWKTAIVAGRKEEADQIGRQHSKQFCSPSWLRDPQEAA